MQAIALRPQRGQITGNLAGLALCVLGMLVFPVACIPLALLLPLFACPLIGHKTQWASFLSAAAPSLISLANGMDFLYCLSLLAICGLPLAATELLRPGKKGASPLAFLFHIAAYAAALTAVSFCASRVLGGDLSAGLADALVSRVEASPRVGVTLYQLAASGLIGVPKAYQRAEMLVFALDPALIRQLLMSLRLTLNLSFAQLLPSLFVQACIIGGLFTALRVQRLQHSYLLVSGQQNPKAVGERVRVAIPPGFSMLQLPPPLRWPVSLIGLGALLCAMTPGSFAQELSLLLYTAFVCVFQLIGAAVAICLLSARHPDRKALYGVLAGFIYIFFPIVLFLIGVLDPVLHFRSKTLFQQEEE